MGGAQTGATAAFFSPEVHGKEILVFAVCDTGGEVEGKRALEPLRGLGEPIADVIGTQPDAGWQTGFDPLLHAGAYNYWKSHNFVELSDGLLDTLERCARLPTGECARFSLASSAAPPAAWLSMPRPTPDRNANFVMNVHTRWRETADEQRSIDRARKFFAETAPHATGGVYVNFMPEDEIERVPSAMAPTTAVSR